MNKNWIKPYIELLKPRVMSLAILSAAAGMAVAQEHNISLAMHGWALLFIAIGAGASGCFNMWWEITADSIMQRTKTRPLPLGIVKPNSALVYAFALTVISIGGLSYFFSISSALWMGLTIVYYVGIYTIYLKPRTDQSIVIGGLAGALPPLIGEAAVSGYTTIDSWLLCAVIFFWTPAHFWALSLFCWKDYAEAGFPTRPQTKGNHITRRDILIYSIISGIIAILPWVWGSAEFIYGYGALWLSILWVIRAWQLYLNKKTPQDFFGFSIIYLFAILILRMADLYVLAYKW